MSVVANVAINIDGKQAQALLKAIQNEVEKLNGSFDNVDKTAKSFGKNILSSIGSVIGPLGALAGVTFGVQQAFDVLARQSKAEAALKTLGVDAKVATAEFTQLSATLHGQTSVVELTAAAYDVASSGFAKTADQVSILDAATKGAVGGLSDINTVGNAVTSVLNAYGMSADQAGMLVDGFIQTQNDGKIVLGEYAGLIGRLAPLGAAAGIGIKELNAAVATITAQGVAPESAVTGLVQAIQSILKPTAEAQALARQLGISFNETGLRSKGLSGFLKDVTKATGGNVTKLTELFGSIDAIKALLPLLSGDMKVFVENIIRQDKAAGAATKAFNDMRNSLGGAMKELQTAFENLIVKLSPLTPAIIAPFKVLAGLLVTVANNLKAIAAISVFMGTLALALNAAAIATKLWTIYTQGLALAQKAAGAAAAFLVALTGPQGIAAVLIATGAATAAYFTMGKVMGDVSVKAVEVKNKQVAIKKPIKEQLTELEKIPTELARQTTAGQLVLDKHQEITQEISNQSSALDRGASITSARYGAEKAINDLMIQQLERQYGLATTAQQRLNIAVAIFKQQAEGAKIEYKQALENIALENRKIELQLVAQKLKLEEIKYEGNLQKIKAIGAKDEVQTAARIDQQVNQALKTQQNVINQVQEQVYAQREVSKYMQETASVQFKSKILTAQTALEQKLVSQEIGGSASQARIFSDNLAYGSLQAAGVTEEMNNISGATIAATVSTTEWKNGVAGGIAVQKELATTAQTTGTVIAETYTKTAQVINTANGATIKSVTAMAVESRNPIMEFLGWLGNEFTNGMIMLGQITQSLFVQPFIDLWNNILKGPVVAFWDWIVGIVGWGMNTAYAIAYRILVLPWIALWEHVLREPVNQMLAWFQTTWSSIVNFFQTNVINPIGSAWNYLTTLLSKAMQEVIKPIQDIWSSIVNFFQTNVIRPISNAWNQLTTLLPKAMDNVAKSVQAIWNGIINGVKNGIRNIMNFVANAINGISNQINKLIISFNKLPGPKIDLIGKINVPAFAHGGVVTKPTLAMVGEAGTEYIIPESKMAATAMNYLAGPGGKVDSPYLKRSKMLERVWNSDWRGTINIKTGPVMEMNNERYVTMDDFEQGLQQVASSVYKGLRTPAGRYAMGTR